MTVRIRTTRSSLEGFNLYFQKKSVPGHRCKSKLFLLVDQDDDFPDPLPSVHNAEALQDP